MLRFVVALEAEAKPLIDRYRLKRDPAARAFSVYRGESTSLVVSGVGKVAAAAATVYLNACDDSLGPAVWLNVGIAGHATRPVGEAVAVHKIRDVASGRAWYPPRVFEAPSSDQHPCTSDQLTTVDRPERDYADPGAYDMEASGFYPTACRFTSSELVHCLKIVSDGPEANLEELTPSRVVRLVEQRLGWVEAWAAACLPLAKELTDLEADPPDLEFCTQRFRFTVAEARQLRRLLARRRTLAPERPLPLDGLAARERGKVVNRRLAEWLDGLAFGSD